MKKRPLCLLIVVFTPLSIRRGGGGEAVEGTRVRLFFLLSRDLERLSGGLDGVVPTLFSLGIDHH